LDKIQARLETKPISVPVTPELQQITLKTQTYDKLKTEARGVDQNEPLLISCLN